MKKIYLIAAALAIACGVLVYMYFSSLEGRVVAAEKKHQAKPVEMTDVVMAATDIPPLTEITEEMIVIESFPAEYVGEEVARSIDDVVGLQADGTLVKGQMIMTTAVGTLDEVVPSLSARIPEGMRAMTLDVYTSQAVGGYPVKGDRVDILGYIEGDDEKGIEPEAAIAFFDVEILEVGNVNYTGEDGAIYSSLTFALTRPQTLQLYELMNKGNLYYTLAPLEKDGGE